MLKKIQPPLFLILLIGFCANTTKAQTYNTQMDGLWQFAEDNSEYVKIKDGKAIIYVKDKFENWDEQNDRISTTTSTRKTTSVFLGNNISVTTIEQFKNPKQTNTHSYNIFYISPYVLMAQDLYYENKIDSAQTLEDSWDTKNAKSIYSAYSGLLLPLKTKKFTLNGSMASSSKFISLVEVLNTMKYTLLKFKLENKTDNTQAFTLHAPDDETAFYITTEDGKKYHLLGQYGFGGFTSISLDKNKELYYYVFFEKIPDKTKKITIREGNCTSGCWNFYDVSLQ